MSTKKPKTDAAPKADERDAIIARQADRLRELSRMVEDRDVRISKWRKYSEDWRRVANAATSLYWDTFHKSQKRLQDATNATASVQNLLDAERATTYRLRTLLKCSLYMFVALGIMFCAAMFR